MSSERPADYELFVRRYEELKKLYFSPKSDPKFDSDGQEMPSAYLTKSQIVEILTKQMRVSVPTHRQDPIRFLQTQDAPQQ
jgi:hypothetical protein